MDVGLVVAGNEVCMGNQIASTDRIVSESQVGTGNTAGFLGIVLKICLDIHIGVITDDLDGVLIGSDCTIRA